MADFPELTTTPESPDDVSRSEVDRLNALVDSYRSAARLHGMRSDGLQGEIAHLRHLMSLREKSLSWRITFPLRGIRALSLGRLPDGQPFSALPERLKTAWRREGMLLPLHMMRRRLAKRPSLPAKARPIERPSTVPGPIGAEAPAPGAVPIRKARTSYDEAVYDDTPQTIPVGSARQFLIIAELSLRQCAKYRVWQKREMLERLGWRVQVVDWRDTDAAMSALQWCAQVIFYRTPGFESVMGLVQEAHRLKLRPWWEVDDLIFDADQYRQNGNLVSLPRSEQATLLFGVKIFRACMLACGRAIASTDALADAMRQAGVDDVQVIENALDGETLSAADDIRATIRPRDDGRIVMLYGSGTNTHDADFREAAEGLVAAMQAEPRLCLRIVGELTVPRELAIFGDRIETIAGMSYRAYLALLADADIALAPLEPTLFNDAKSNIKYLEAASVGVASVCSPRAAFRVIMRDGTNGMMADTPAQWRDAVLALARDSDRRAEIGREARIDVLARYAPEAVAVDQVRPAFGVPPARDRKDAFRALMANVYFAPRSFGGATLVVEEMCRRLQARGLDIGVFTSRPHLHGRANGTLRYDVDGISVLSAIIPPDYDQVAYLDNPKLAEYFGAWLDAFQPDIVHIHALQGLGTALLRLCQERSVPYAITLHDAWWLCDRQFMVRGDGKYCFQTRIDLRVCQECLPGARHLQDRATLMRQALMGASLLISPSESHRALYLANGVAPERIVVNRNGFTWPARPRAPRPVGAPLRFGFVGGTEAVKGYPLIRKVFERLERADWELVLVDNKLNLGFHSIDVAAWSVKGKIRVVPAYTSETMDDFFDSIDVMLFPSQWKESYGLTVREALARDVWVVTTAPGGQAEDVRDGVNGTHVPLEASEPAFFQAIEALLDDRERFVAGYVNSHKDELPDFDTQAEELERLLKMAAQLTPQAKMAPLTC
jgi:O-antigen biosynthesis protein